MGCSDSKADSISYNQKRLRVKTQHSTAESQNAKISNVQVSNVRAVFLGDSSVGKSSLTMRYFHDDFKDTYSITFGGIFYKKQIRVSKDLNISLQAWDTGGQEKYRSIAPLYYRNASIAFLVCSLTDHNQISSLEYWYSQLSQKLSKDDICIVVLANKCDLTRGSQSSQIQQWCLQNNIQYFECSAKTGQGVQQAFSKGIQMHVKKLKY